MTDCGDHGGTNSAGDPCGNPEGWGTDFETGKCRFHRGTSPDGESHEDNDYATDHGAFKEHFRSDLTDDEIDAIDALVDALEDITGPRAIAAESAAEALMKYKRSADSRFLREARQWFGDFNLIPNSDDVNLGGQDGNPMKVVMNETVHETDWSEE
jgi:hypothetical protein